MNIFIGPTEISGVAHALKKSFVSLGVSSETVFSHVHPFQYERDTVCPWIVSAWQRFGEYRSRTLRNQWLLKSITLASHISFSFMVLAWAVAKFDTFIFLYGQTITNTTLELVLLRALGKKIIFLYVGSDARPPYIDGPQFPASAPVNWWHLARVTKLCKRRLEVQEKYADICINSPSSAQLHAKPFINWFKTGLPKVLNEHEYDGLAKRNSKIRIVHSPSHPEAKGSVIIVSVIERLKSKGYPIELVKIEGMPNAMVMQELANCDFVIDQLYSDTPMAAFATEAAHFGKPAVVGGYFACSVQQYLAAEDIPPSLFVHPDGLEQAIERLIVDEDFRIALGAQAKEFVCRNWSPEKVAKRFLDLMEGKIPADWWLDPQAIRYVQGCGMPEAHAKSLVRGLIQRYGKGSLQLADKPAVERVFVEFADLDPDSAQ